MTDYHLAQINIAKFRTPMDAPENKDFVDQIDPVNAMAEAQPGFIWRLTGDDGQDATSIRAFDDPNMLINMSVWTDIDALTAFVYRQKDHRSVFRDRAKWIEPVSPHLALWWIKAGSVPTLMEGKAKLEHLAAHGPTPEAFTFKDRFEAPE